MAIINVPEIIPSSLGGGNRKQSMEKILKYCYNNQDFKCIESDINQYNIFCLLELAHCLGIKSLKLYLENKIIKNYIDKDNVTKLAIESKIFDLQKLNKECISFIIKNFKYVKIFKNDIIDLDYNSFKQIIISDEINIDNEKDISDFVISYIISRRNLKEEIKEKVNKEENKEKNEEKKEEEKVEENKEKEKEENKDENNEKKEKENDVNEKWKKYLNELKDSVKKRELSKEEEKELILCIRFNFLPHTELVRLINEPVMNEYKDLLLNAMSLKLNSYEETQNNEKSIFNLNPRHYQNQENKEKDNNNINNDINRNNRYNNNLYYLQNVFMNKNNIKMMNNKSMANTNNKNNFNNNLDSDYFYKSSDFYKYPIPNLYNNKFNKENYYNINNNNFNNEDYLNRYNDYDGYNNDNNFDNNEDEKHLLNSQYFNISNKKEKEKINRYREMIKPEKNNIQNKERSSLSSDHNQIIYPVNYHIKFKYKSDFDKNGALYYIGTYGLSRKYSNPHELKLIKAFGSSLLSGYYSDFVGRNIVNLCTENEENSFLGVDLGPNRSLIPTLYSIRNRDSSSNVLLNWSLQGSNDKINFEILDKRLFNIEDNYKKDKYKQYKNLLKEPKTTSTWGISKRIREKLQNGFRYFIIKQIGKNSSGNYNLAISGFELYGEGIGSGWNFS